MVAATWSGSPRAAIAAMTMGFRPCTWMTHPWSCFSRSVRTSRRSAAGRIAHSRTGMPSLRPFAITLPGPIVMSSTVPDLRWAPLRAMTWVMAPPMSAPLTMWAICIPIPLGRFQTSTERLGLDPSTVPLDYSRLGCEGRAAVAPSPVRGREGVSYARDVGEVDGGAGARLAHDPRRLSLEGHGGHDWDAHADVLENLPGGEVDLALYQEEDVGGGQVPHQRAVGHIWGHLHDRVEGVSGDQAADAVLVDVPDELDLESRGVHVGRGDQLGQGLQHVVGTPAPVEGAGVDDAELLVPLVAWGVVGEVVRIEAVGYGDGAVAHPRRVGDEVLQHARRVRYQVVAARDDGLLHPPLCREAQPLQQLVAAVGVVGPLVAEVGYPRDVGAASLQVEGHQVAAVGCLLYTSDAADDLTRVD